MVFNDQYRDIILAEAQNNLNLFFIHSNKYDSAEDLSDESINMSTLSSSSSSPSSSDTSNFKNNSNLIKSSVEDLSFSSSTNGSICSSSLISKVSRDLLFLTVYFSLSLYLLPIPYRL